MSFQNFNVQPASLVVPEDTRYSTHIPQTAFNGSMSVAPPARFPNTYTAQTAGPKFKISMGALPSGIMAMGSALYNTAGEFRSMRRC